MHPTATQLSQNLRIAPSLGLALALACGSAHAEGLRIGIDYEWEKDRTSGIGNNALSLKPGWEFGKEDLINVVELLIDHNQDARADLDGNRFRETKLFLRLRHNREIGGNVGYFIRGGLGRSLNNEQNFSYGYLEAGLKYDLGKWGWTVSLREIDSIDGTKGQRVTKLITGPSFSFDSRNEVELRFSKSHRDEHAHSFEVGYTHKY